MERSLLSVALICAMITMFSANQGPTINPQLTSHNSETETLLGLDKGSQRSVSAQIAAAPALNNVKLGPETLDFSSTMHTLTKHMIVLSPERRSEVSVLAASLAAGAETKLAAPKNDVGDHLTLLAKTIDTLSPEERETLVSLASSLALTK